MYHFDIMERTVGADRLSVYFFSQIFVCVLIIVTSLANLTLRGEGEEKIWLVLLSSGIGILIPSPINIQ